MQIDNAKYKIDEINRYKTQNPKTQIVLATSLRKDNYHIVRLQHKEFGKTKRWNTFTVSRNGEIFQHYDTKFHSDFLGIKEADKQSLSIVLENMGCLFQTPHGKYINWLNEICDPNNIEEKEWLGYSFWEKFSEEQIENTVHLCNDLCDEFSIPKACIEFHHYHKDTVRFKGIVFRSNYIEDCSDINPLFDIKKFNEMLSNVSV
jgi:N-acetyl-anhydromuramyl-L-alanine amidase AmpD